MEQDRLKLLAEAEKRGILNPQGIAFMAEARSKGLIPTSEPQAPATPTPADQYDGPPIEYGAQDAIVNGMTFGFADEVGALGAAVGRGIGDFIKGEDTGSFGDHFTQHQAAQARAKDNYEEENPISGIGLDVAGGLLSGGALAKGAYNTGKTALGRMGRLAGGGALAGGVSGAGNTNGGLTDRVKGAGAGAAVGGLLGIALPSAGNLAMKGAKKLGDFAGRGDPALKAKDKVLQALKRDKLTPETIKSQAEDNALAGIKSETISDLAGENTSRLSKTVFQQPGEARNDAAEFFLQRQMGQGDRIKADLNGLSKNTDLSGTFDGLIASQQRAAKPLYDAAYKVDVPLTDGLKLTLGTPAGRQAYQKASKLAANEGQALPKIKELMDTDGTINTKWLDYVKRGMDDVLAKHRNPVTGKIETNEGRIIDNLRRDFIGEIDSVNPTYAQARSSFSSHAESLDALSKGQRFMNGDLDIGAKTLRNMSASDKELFRAGLAKSLRDLIDSAGDGHNKVLRVWGSPKKREMLKLAFPNQKSFNAFETAMRREMKMAANARTITQGSQTKANLMDQEDFNVDPNHLVSIANGDVRGLLGNGLLGAIKSRSQGINDAVSKEMSSYLFQPVNKGLLGDLIERSTLNKIAQKKAQGLTQGYSGGQGAFSGSLLADHFNNR